MKISNESRIRHKVKKMQLKPVLVTELCTIGIVLCEIGHKQYYTNIKWSGSIAYVLVVNDINDNQITHCD